MESQKNENFIKTIESITMMRHALPSYTKICLIITAILSSLSPLLSFRQQLMGQSASSAVIAESQYSAFPEDSLLELTSFGAIRYWPDESEPLGTPSSIDEINQ